jgi:hypothetical protein
MFWPSHWPSHKLTPPKEKPKLAARKKLKAKMFWLKSDQKFLLMGILEKDCDKNFRW